MDNTMMILVESDPSLSLMLNFLNQGVLEESFGRTLTDERYYEYTSNDTRQQFLAKYGTLYEIYMAKTLIEYVGKPVENFIMFLRYGYSRYCVPSHVASGLANLPLDKVCSLVLNKGQ